MIRKFQSQLFYYEEGYTEKQISSQRIPREFLISENMLLPVLLCRLLLGNVKLGYNSTKSTSISKDVFSKFPYDANQNFHNEKFGNLKTIISDLNFEDESVLKSLKVHSLKNRSLYNDLISEISCYIFYSSKGSYTTAFLHLYRCYEYISYTIPLTYIKGQDSYEDSYSELRSFFGENNSGELKFFQTFILESFFKKNQFSSNIFSNKIEILFSETDFEIIRNNWKDLLKNSSDSNKKVLNKFLRGYNIDAKESFFQFNQDTFSLEIESIFFHNFFITVRNNCFHFLSDRPNKLKSTTLIFDTFFEYINPFIYNWIANIYKHILYAEFNEN